MRKSTNPFISFLKDLTYSGLEVFGKYYSTYRGIIVDNDDPEKLHRVKLLIPQINGSHVHDYWAFPKGLFSGLGYGVQVIPKKGDIVWVEFEGGHAEVPLWTHGYRSKKEVPKDKELQDVNTFWFKTPKGNLVLINDTKNTIRIELSTGHTIEINDTAISSVHSKAISLGSLNTSKYKGVLGEELIDVIKKQQAIQSKMSGLLKTAIAASTTALSPALIYASMTPTLLQVDADILSLNLELDKILSKKITLD